MESVLIGLLFVAAIVFGIYKGAMADVGSSPNEHVVCPHCQSRGTVTATTVKRKQGISGGKATGALLTGGVSLFATGLSRKQQITRMKCGKCRVEWDVA